MVPWGYVAALQSDPIEKKPFFHVLPGSDALTFGMLGCDFHCSYCQNWLTSQAMRDPESDVSVNYVQPISPEQVARYARRMGAKVVASSYNEPLITSEWAAGIFRRALAEGLKCVFISNGNATPEALQYLRPYLIGYKVDLKTMQDRHYRQLGGVLCGVAPDRATVADPKRTLVPLMGGHNSRRDPGMLGFNQLVKSQGVEYLAGDNEIIYKIPGRSLVGTVGPAARVRGITLANYDDGSVYLFALAGGSGIYYANISNGVTATLAFTMPATTTLRSTNNQFLSAAHYANRWFVCTDNDSGVVVESDATVVDHGMYAPLQGKLTLSTYTVATAVDVQMGLDSTSHSAGTGKWWAVVYATPIPGTPIEANQIVAATTMLTQSTQAFCILSTANTTTFTNRQIELINPGTVSLYSTNS